MTEEVTFRHTLPVQLRFNDIDQLGHVNNSVYFAFYDMAKVNYFSAVSPQLNAGRETGLVIANVNANFFLPVYLHDEISVQTVTRAIGNKSLKLLQRIVDANGAVKASCETVLVRIDFRTGQTCEIPASWREAIAAYEGCSF